VNLIEFVTSLSTLVLWTAGSRPHDAAQKAWATLSEAGRTKTAILPTKDGWIDKVKDENNGVFGWNVFLTPDSPLMMLVEWALPADAAALVEEASDAAKTIAEDVKSKVIGGYVAAGVAGVTVLGIVAAVVYSSRKKKRGRR